MRIALIGPVLPLRGGIAQHTTMLHRSLAPRCELLTLSFTRQYPNWLYPGQGQSERNQATYREPGVEYCIDGLNPLTWRAAKRHLQVFRPRAVMVPWWTVYWAPWALHIIAAIRATGGRLVFIVHNVVDHEAATWKRWSTSHILARGDRFIVHTQAAAQELSKLMGEEKQITVHPHPIYDQFPTGVPALPRRSALELLFFGFVRDYKGLDILLEALAGLDRQDWHLNIVGEFWGETERSCQARIEEFGLSTRIEVVPRYVTETEAAGFFGRADFVVLPYTQTSGTGIVPLAYHYNKPVVVSDIGALAETALEGKTGWHFRGGSAASLGNTLAARSAEEAKKMVPAIEELKKRWSWDSLAQTLLDISA